MRKQLIVFAVCLFVVADGWAGDPWKEKSFKQWDANDVQRILSDSPWAKTTKVEAPWIKGGQEVGLDVGASNAGGLTAAGVSPSMTSQPGQAPIPIVPVVIRWASASTIRQANARDGVLRGAMMESNVERYLAQEFKEYVVVVLGRDLSPFADVDEKTLKEKAYLAPKKSRQKFPPVRVAVSKADAKTVTAAIFYFPKKTEAGEAIIALDEKEVEFSCRAQGVTLRVKFEPQKMVGKQGLDL